jgi:hypothetical protein
VTEDVLCTGEVERFVSILYSLCVEELLLTDDRVVASTQSSPS